MTSPGRTGNLEKCLRSWPGWNLIEKGCFSNAGGQTSPIHCGLQHRRDSKECCGISFQEFVFPRFKQSCLSLARDGVNKFAEAFISSKDLWKGKIWSMFPRVLATYTKCDLQKGNAVVLGVLVFEIGISDVINSLGKYHHALFSTTFWVFIALESGDIRFCLGGLMASSLYSRGLHTWPL